MTGMPEYGVWSFVKRLGKKLKKIAPVIGSIVGFAYGGPKGAGIGKAIGGVIKTGDLDFQNALTDFGTGWAMGNFATGMGMKGGRGFKSIFKGAGKGGMWGWGATPTIQHTIEQGDTVASIAKEYGISEQDLLSANPGAMPVVGNSLNIPKLDTSVGGFIQQAGAKIAGGLGGGPMPTDLATGKPYEFGLMEQFKGLSAGQKLGVGALGLAALKQTGIFDEEELGDVPPGIQTEMEGLQAYANQPLRAATQGQWGVGSPTVSTPAIPSHTSFYTPPPNRSLADVLSELNQNKIGLSGFPAFS
jgi:LysM repeat protein